MDFKYIFGPVRSSRLGLSLGLELLGDKICDFDCLYCEVGKTLVHTMQRDAYVPAAEILRELEEWFELGYNSPDFITLGGMGEPCLNSEMGMVIHGVKKMRPDIPVAVLTNSSLLSQPEVRRELNLADAVLPSLDTVVEKEFQLLNRPCSGILLKDILDGLIEFRKEFGGNIYLEILLVAGFNDSKDNLYGLKEFCRRLSPERIDLTRMTRPGAYIKAPKVDPELESQWRKVLDIGGPVRKSADNQILNEFELEVDQETVLASLRRRPQTVEQLASALGTSPDAIQKIVKELLHSGQLSSNRDLGVDKNFFSVR
ncbi:MAG: radical SAM protein [Desulfovibrionales bacterium]